jgi:large subunit ribosomal protein L22
MAEAKAILKNVRIAPRKSRVIIDLIRGQGVPRARAILKYTPRHAAKVVAKLLDSAVANAEQKELGDTDSLRVFRAYVDCGPTFKRFRPRSMGRANSIHKRTSTITIILSQSGAKS